MNARSGGTRRAVAAVALATLLVFAATPASEAGAARNGTWVGPTSAREASAFWTVARMRAAKPLELTRSASHKRRGGRHGHRGKPHRIAPRVGAFGADFE